MRAPEAQTDLRHGLINACLPVAALVAFWLPLLQPLIQRGMMTCSHDGALYLLRAFQLDVMVRQGVVWPRWAPGMVLGYGYPLFNFHPPLSLYPGVLLNLLGLSLLQGWNLSVGLSLLASGLTMYLWARQVLGARGGFVAAIAYMVAPYQLYDAYWRGNIPETLTLPVLPLVMWAALRVTQTRRWRYVVIGAAAYAAVWLMHAPASLMVSLVLGVYLLVLIWNSPERARRVLQLGGMLLLGAGLAAFFLVPAFLERDQVQYWRAIASTGADYRNYFLSLAELIGPAQTSDPLLINPAPPHSIGNALGLMVIAGAMLTWRRRARLEADFKRHVVWAVVTLVGVMVMMLPISEPVWAHVPLMPFIQFPWRFLGVASMLASLIAGAAVTAAVENGQSARAWSVRRESVMGVGLLVLWVGAVPWMYPRLCAAPENHTQSSYVSYEAATGLLGTTALSEYLPVAAQEVPTTSPMAAAMLAGQPTTRWDAPGARVLESSDDGLHADLKLESAVPVSVTYRAFYFPGWQARIDGQPVPISITYPAGVMWVNVPAGQHQVLFRFESTPLRTISEVVSALALLLAVLLLVLDRRRSLASSDFRVSAGASIPVWLSLVAVGVLISGLKLGALDRFDTPLRWRRLQAGQFKGAEHAPNGSIVIGERARLLGFDVDPEPVASGDVMVVDLYWTLTGSYKLRAAVRVLDGQGLEWSDKNELPLTRGSYAGPPPSREWPVGMYADDRHAVRVLPGTPPGEYLLVVVPFNPDTLEPRPVTAGQPAPGDYPGVVIGKIKVSTPPRSQPAEALELAARTMRPLGSDLTLVGYSQDRTEASPGQDMRLELGWQAERRSQVDYSARIELVDLSGRVIGQFPVKPGGDYFPTSQWAAGQVIRSQLLARVPGRAESGQYQWRVVLLDGNGASVGLAVLGTLAVNAPPRVLTAPVMPHSFEARLGDWAALTGFDAPSSVAVGQTLTATLVWQARGETGQEYKVFVHVVAPDGRVVAQSDAAPAGWGRPTSGWRAGEYVVDMHTLQIRGDVTPGAYRLVVGMYDPDTGQRLTSSEGKDRLDLGELLVMNR
jgi:hypothetical protein